MGQNISRSWKNNKSGVLRRRVPVYRKKDWQVANNDLSMTVDAFLSRQAAATEDAKAAEDAKVSTPPP